MKRFLHPVFLLLSCLVATAGLHAQTPVASYPFTGDAKDQSVFANHATVNGASLAQDRFGVANSAFSFDGTQSAITAPNADQLNSAHATVSFWINPDEFPGQGEAYVLSFGGWQERWKASLPNHGKLVFTTHSGGACCSDMDSGTPLTLDTWTHVVLVHNGTQDIIYFNGARVNEKAVAGDLDQTTHPLGIGYDPIDRANYFNGALDDVILYDVALSDGEIASLYALQNTPPVFAPGKVADYKFNGNGTDASGYGNHAQLTDVKPTTDRFGFGNSALSFNGTSSEVLASNSLQLNSDFTTVSFWVKVNALPGNGESFLMSHGGWQERWKSSLPTHAKVVWTTNGSGISDMDAGNGNELPVGVWKHVVLVHDGTNDQIYIDGALAASKAVTGSLNNTTHPLGIGFNPIDGGNWLDGAIDDVEIYNYALSGAEIGLLNTIQSAFPGTADDLVASYSLNGDGTDDSQFANHAVVDAGASATTNRHGWASNALNGYATAANSEALQSDFTTISFWINPNSFPGSGEVYLLSNGGWQERWKISMPNHGKPVFTTHSGGACCSDMDSGTPLNPGVWTHVVMTHDGVNDIIYFNGLQVNSKAVAGALDKTKHPLGIGWDPIDQGGIFDGSLDDVQIYNRALSAGEVFVLFADQNQTPTVAGLLVADYKFSGNARDDTDYHNDARVQGAQLATDRFGNTNQAYSFNGVNQSIVAENSPQLGSLSTTLSFWINPASFPASGEVFILSHGGWQQRWKVSMPNHGKPVFTTHSNGACCSDLDSGTPLEIGSWTHVVMVHDGLKDIIYFDGARVNEKDAVGALDQTTHPLGIGFDPIDNNYFFHGSLDEVQVYRVALTDGEIAALYALQSQAPGDPDGEAPCAPLNLTAEVVFTTVHLSWLPATDNVGVVAYNVYQDGVQIATTSDVHLSITGLTPLTEFVFGVTAVDAAGYESLPTTLKVTSGEDESPDTTPPTVPGNISATAASNSILVTWEASTDDRQVAGYVVLVDGVIFDTVSASTLSIFVGGLDSETFYTFEVYAFDLAGNNSGLAEITLSTTEPINTGEEGMVAHYPFDGNANDATPYQNHGVIGGNPVFEAPGHANGGSHNIKFDGDGDSVLVANAVQLISDYATVAFWIRVDGTNLEDAEAYVLDFGNWDQRWKVSLPQHLKIVWTTNSKNALFPNFISDMDSGDGNEMVKDFWWHVTMVHDGVDDIIYVDGEEVNRKAAEGTLNSTARPLGIGNNSDNGKQYFIGALDELKLYNKALTSEEITKLFETGTTGLQFLTPELTGYIDVLYPNPGIDEMVLLHRFNGSEDVMIRIFDQMGRQVDGFRFDKEAVATGRMDLKLGKYAAGNYALNFVVGGKNLGSIPFVKL